MTGAHTAVGVRSAAAPSARAGFSLVEVLTTIVILSTLALTGMPVFSTLQQEYNLRGAVRRVYGELQKARLTAVERNARYRAQITRDGLVTLQGYDIDTGEWKDVSVDSSSSNVARGIYVTGASVVTFSPDGMAAAPAQLTLLNSVGMQKRIVVNRCGSIEVG